MSSKIFFLVFLGFILAITQADEESDRDAALIRNYATVEDPRVLNQVWNGYSLRITLLLQIGKRVSIQKANRQQVEALRREWREIEELELECRAETKQIIDSLRKPAKVRAVQEWTAAIQLAIRYFEAFKRACRAGDAQSVKSIILQTRTSSRQLKIRISNLISIRV